MMLKPDFCTLAHCLPPKKNPPASQSQRLRPPGQQKINLQHLKFFGPEFVATKPKLETGALQRGFLMEPGQKGEQVAKRRVSDRETGPMTQLTGTGSCVFWTLASFCGRKCARD